MITVTKDAVAAWIAELQAQPHLSLKEERTLAVLQELLAYKTAEIKVESP